MSRSGADLSASYEAKEKAAIGRLFAALNSSSVTACNLVFTGSSSTAGAWATTEARRYVNLLVSQIQSAYPAPGGVEAVTVAHTESVWGTISTTPGVHGYNGGQGGTTSATYMNDTEAVAIMSVNPAMVMHMIGSNDYGESMAPAVYKTNVQGRVDKLFSLATKPLVQVLVHTYHRWDIAGTVDGSLYGKALKEIATATDNVIYIDLASLFATVDVPGSDPYGVIDADNVHPNDSGHRMIADLLARALRIPPAKIPTALTDTATRVTARLTSDTFSGADAADINGRAFDLLIGGTAKTWAADITNQVAIGSTKLVRGAPGTLNNFTANVAETTMNIEISFTLTTVPTGDNLLVDIHRQLSTVAGTPNTYRMLVASGGALSIAKRIGGAQTVLATGPTAVIGDRLAFSYNKGTLEVRRNGTLAITTTNSEITATGFIGISGTAALTAFGMDDLAIEAVT